MNINNEKVFKNVDIPDMDTDLNNIANEYWNNILNNYTKIANDSKKILEISLKKDICKPLVIYYLFFIIEISLKLYLLKFSTIEEVDKYAHNITRLTQKINENEKDLNFQELYFMLKKFKDSKKQNINFDKYYDFKYNRGSKEKNLIFEQEVSKEDKMTIMEVLKMDRFTFAQCIKSEQNEDTVKLIGEIDTEMLNRRDLIERLYYALPLVERMILEIFKLVPESDIEYYQQGIMRTPIEIIENNNENKIIPDRIVNIIEKYFKADGIRNKLFHVEELNTVIEGYFTDITYLIMELLQILKSRIKLYKEFEIKEIEKIE